MNRCDIWMAISYQKMIMSYHVFNQTTMHLFNMCHSLSWVFQNTGILVTGQTFSSQLWDIVSNSPLTHLIKLGKGGEHRLVELTCYLRFFFFIKKRRKSYTSLIVRDYISNIQIESFDLIKMPRATCQLQIHSTVVVFYASSDWMTFLCRSRQVTWQSHQEGEKFDPYFIF